MSNTMQPFDIIRITQTVNAKLWIHYDAPFTDAIDVQVAPETILISSVNNFDGKEQFRFVPNEGQDHHEILKFYKYDIPKGRSLSCTFEVPTTELSGKFEVIEPFDYSNLNPDFGSHIYLLATLYFRNDMQKISTKKWSSFVTDFTPLEKIIAEYDDMFMTINDVINAISFEIQRQVYASKGYNWKGEFPFVLGKI